MLQTNVYLNLAASSMVSFAGTVLLSAMKETDQMVVATLIALACILGAVGGG